ncbi:MAG: undecaprenyl-diphosphate phosphatase [Solirubrobacterales bacterium]
MLLGLIQGPTELMPVSSSAHLEMVPRLAGWDWESIDPELRKAFEVALHAGTALAMVVIRRKELADELARFDARRASVLILSFIPAAVVGYGLERQIERHLGGPVVTAAGLAAGAVAMALADRLPQERSRGDAGPLDGLALGLGQAAALVPGVSRNGATLTAARLRRFTREQANALSRTVALPVIAGASLLKGVRLARRGIDRHKARWIGIGVASSFVSTLVSARLVEQVERDRSLAPYAAYRIALALLIVAKLGRSDGPSGRPEDGVESEVVVRSRPQRVTG